MDRAVSTRRTLEMAKTRAEAVRVHRDGLEDGWADGFVASLGPDFFALQLVDKAARLDGFTCIRYVDITDCAAPAPNAEFLLKALMARGEQRREIDIDLTSL